MFTLTFLCWTVNFHINILVTFHKDLYKSVHSNVRHGRKDVLLLCSSK